MDRAQALQRFLAPGRVAFIGGDEAEKAIGQSERIGFVGTCIPVHPTRGLMAGRLCLPDVGALTQPPDAAFVAVPAPAAVAVVRELADMGCGGVLVHSSGFAEVGESGVALQAALVAAAGDMPLLGPNCWGFVNYLDRASLWPDGLGGSPVESGVAIISQSGNLAITLGMQDRSLRLAYLLSVGNQAQTNESDLIEALVGDPRVSAIGLLLEGIGDVRHFEQAVLKAREARVPVVVLKTGRSRLGAGVTLSHTATLSGDDACYQALFARLGVACSHTEPEFLEVLKFLDVVGPLSGRRLLSLSCSGGEAALMADLAERAGLEFPVLTPSHAARLGELAKLGYPASNPFDYHTYIWGDRDGTRNLFKAAVEVDAQVAALVLDLPRGSNSQDIADWQDVADAFAQATASVNHLHGMVVGGLPECMPAPFREQLVARGVAPMQGMHEALQAISGAAQIGMAWGGPVAPALSTPSAPGTQAGERRRTLDEVSAKQALRMAGLTIPNGLAVGPEAVVETARQLGFPVVLKVVSARLAHKTELGAVAVGLANDTEVVTALERMRPLGQLFLVEECVRDVIAEMLVGVRYDSQFGLVMVLGFGGTLVELLADTSTLLLPASESQIEAAIESLRLARLLSGYRGRPVADMPKVVAAVSKIAAFALDNADRLLELDVNPLMVTADNAIAADALLVLRG